MSTAETTTTPDTAAIIERESRGEGAPAAPPVPPQPSAEEIAAAIDAAAAMMQEETGLELPEGIPLPHLVWNSTLNKPVDAHKACGTDERPCPICSVRRERGENGAVIDKYLKCVIYPGTEKPKGSASARKPAEKVLTPTEKALEAVKAGADEVDPAVMDPAGVKVLLGMGRPVLIGALEALVKSEKADKAKRAEALRAEALRKYEIDLKRAEEENKPYLEQIAALEEELEPLQAQVAELSGQIEDLRSLLTVVEPPEEPTATKKTAAKPQGDGTKKQRRTDGIAYEDQRYKFDAKYQLWYRFCKRFPDLKLPQRELTPLAKANGILPKDVSEITDDLLDTVAALVMANEE